MYRFKSFIAALRKTMLRAHRQAWAWQDEWFGLTMADIREIEKETAEALKKKMATSEDTDGDNDDEKDDDTTFARQSSTSSSIVGDIPPSVSPSASANSLAIAAAVQQHKSSESSGASAVLPEKSLPIQVQISDLSVTCNSPSEESVPNCTETLSFKSAENVMKGHHTARAKSSSKGALHSPGANSSKSFDLLASWRMESLVRKDSDSEPSDDDEFFDCLGKLLFMQ